MSNRFRLITAALGVAVVVAVVVVVKVAGGGSDSTASTTATGPQTIRIVVKDGQVEGGLAHAKVEQGTRVVLDVTADVADEVHLHGYDIMREVRPGQPARIAFTARLPGRFEAELENAKQQILDLEVEP